MRGSELDACSLLAACEGRLFDLRDDPGEERSLWGSQDALAVAARDRLQAAIGDWRGGG